MTTFFAVVSGLVVAGGVASADPTSADWAAVRQCESGGRYNINTGNGYYGAYQFDLPTWRSVGGSGLPSEATPAEQDLRALTLYRMRGWSPWICAALVGVSNDSDAKSGVKPPATGNQSSAPAGNEGAATPAAPGAPAYPGRQFREGDFSDALKVWQKQMGTRGYPLTGTGYFGPSTKAAVLKIQGEQGLNVVGFIGPKTWAAAWAGAAAAPTPATPYVPATDATCSVGAATAPTWPGKQFNPGDTARELQCFQRQMGKRGYGLSGTGFYGATTKTVVVDLQKRNGLNPSGILGPQTWKAAWEGK
ncbi:hypothetical protein EH165_14015 [Nakamurella antarctica]|uniref:Transglycosylase n=1 Tax=Nakamurella antarctica TaxID=1902245 RepID=A0A3G8ZPC6_9ACTN|nr:transglycosylase family protein [Nakamurella antarctica]AZI59089.1 hypothetical protein EH165_14015 [Nakamurella antarctica]